jgi:hypothetical protein
LRRPFGNQLRLDPARMNKRGPNGQQEQEKQSPHALAG